MMEQAASIQDRARVRLRPKADAQRLRHGYPWVFDSDLVLDRRSRALPAGSLAVLEDTARAPIGLAAINPGSRIVARLLDPDWTARVDDAWCAARIQRALRLRERLYDAPYYRLVHAEADGLPGVIIDRFGDIAVIQPNAAWAETHLRSLTDALSAVTGVTTVIKNASGRARALEGLDDATAVLTGSAPTAPIPVEMNGATYMADLTTGQKTGLFYDQRPNHAFAARLARGARVLDVCAHVGGFGLAALAGGATHVTAIDASDAALGLAREGAATTGVDARFATRAGDAFELLSELADEGARYDVVICDPPAFAPAKPALAAGLRAYERLARRAADVVEPGGVLGLCSCSHAAGLEKFRNASARGIGRAGRTGRLIHTGGAGPDHPLMPQLGESGYLKALFFAL